MGKIRVTFSERDGIGIAKEILESNNIPIDRLEDDSISNDYLHDYHIDINDDIDSMVVDVDKYVGTDSWSFIMSFVSIDSVIKNNDDYDKHCKTINAIANSIHNHLCDHKDYNIIIDDLNEMPIGLFVDPEYAELEIVFRYVTEKIGPITIQFNENE